MLHEPEHWKTFVEHSETMDEKPTRPTKHEFVFRRFYRRAESRLSRRKCAIGIALITTLLYLSSGSGIQLAHSCYAKDDTHSKSILLSSSPQEDLRFNWSAVSLTNVHSQILTNDNSLTHPRILSILPVSINFIVLDLRSL